MNRVESVKEYAKVALTTEVTAHDYEHSLRVMKIASYIAKELDADLEIVEVAAITHDIIDKKVAKDVAVARVALRGKLLSVGYSKAQVDHIFDIIENMSYSSGRIPKTLEGKIVQDADRLDAVGAIAIARAFAYGGAKNRVIYEKDDKTCGIAHFYDKLLLLKDMMNTDVARELAQSRHQFMESYLKQFFVEWNLEDIEF